MSSNVPEGMTEPVTSAEEPRFHYYADHLPDGHPWSWTTVLCVGCEVMVHAANNEFMQPWVETGRGAYCIQCFATFDYADGDGLRLPSVGVDEYLYRVPPVLDG